VRVRRPQRHGFMVLASLKRLWDNSATPKRFK